MSGSNAEDDDWDARLDAHEATQGGSPLVADLVPGPIFNATAGSPGAARGIPAFQLSQPDLDFSDDEDEQGGVEMGRGGRGGAAAGLSGGARAAGLSSGKAAAARQEEPPTLGSGASYTPRSGETETSAADVADDAIGTRGTETGEGGGGGGGSRGGAEGEGFFPQGSGRKAAKALSTPREGEPGRVTEVGPVRAAVDSAAASPYQAGSGGGGGGSPRRRSAGGSSVPWSREEIDVLQAMIVEFPEKDPSTGKRVDRTARARNIREGMVRRLPHLPQRGKNEIREQCKILKGAAKRASSSFALSSIDGGAGARAGGTLGEADDGRTPFEGKEGKELMATIETIIQTAPPASPSSTAAAAAAAEAEEETARVAAESEEARVLAERGKEAAARAAAEKEAAAAAAVAAAAAKAEVEAEAAQVAKEAALEKERQEAEAAAAASKAEAEAKARVAAEETEAKEAEEAKSGGTPIARPPQSDNPRSDPSSPQRPVQAFRQVSSPTTTSSASSSASSSPSSSPPPAQPWAGCLLPTDEVTFKWRSPEFADEFQLGVDVKSELDRQQNLSLVSERMHADRDMLKEKCSRVETLVETWEAAARAPLQATPRRVSMASAAVQASAQDDAATLTGQVRLFF